MKEDKSDELTEYFAEAGSWAADREDTRRRSLRLAWIIAGVATFVAGAEAIALVALAPLKTAVPYTLLVDRQTGYVQALDPVNGERVTPDAALTRSFLVQYVVARESFAIGALQHNYRKAVLWSDGTVRTSYIALMQASNPLSPLAAYPRRTIIDVQIKSVSMLDNDTALVRYQTFRQDPGAQPRDDGSWIATVSFRYATEPMSAEDRLTNPLGFQVIRYSKAVEVVPEPTPPVVSAPAQTGSRPVPQPLASQPQATAADDIAPPPRTIRVRPAGREVE